MKSEKFKACAKEEKEDEYTKKVKENYEKLSLILGEILMDACEKYHERIHKELDICINPEQFFYAVQQVQLVKIPLHKSDKRH